MSTRQQRLATEDRLCLIQTLNALPKAQFNTLLVAINPPSGNIPSDTAAQSDRCVKLLEWAESRIGCGLFEVEKVLSKIIAAESKVDEKLLAFVISGKVSSSTASELQAFVKLLRKKTGDDSIDIAFFQEGSIKAIVNGSPEELAKLQEMFEAGELEQLDIPPVEAVTPIDSNTQDARKARLIQALRLRERSSISFAHSYVRVLEMVRNLDLSKADLRGANLRNIDLTRVNLTGADLTHADVTGTIFGANPGLTEADKRELKSRGAIFQDPPSSDIPALVLR